MIPGDQGARLTSNCSVIDR